MEENQSLTKIITDIYQTFFDVLRNTASLVVIEAKQVKWAFVKMTITIFAVLLSVFFTWLGLCSVICITLTMYGFSLLTSVLSVFLLNFILMMASITYMVSQNKNMLFPATSKQLGRALNRSKDTINE